MPSGGSIGSISAAARSTKYELTSYPIFSWKAVQCRTPGVISFTGARLTLRGRAPQCPPARGPALEPLGEALHAQLTRRRGARLAVGGAVGRQLDRDGAQRRDLLEVTQLVGLPVQRRAHA